MVWRLAASSALLTSAILGPPLLSVLLWRLFLRYQRALLVLTLIAIPTLLALDWWIDHSAVNYNPALEMGWIAAWPLLLWLGWWKARRWMLARILLLGLPLAWMAVSLFLWAYLAGIPKLEYELALRRCGHQPVIASRSFFGGSSYSLPGDPDYGIGITGAEFYCTEREAKDAGFSRMPTVSDGADFAAIENTKGVVGH